MVGPLAPCSSSVQTAVETEPLTVLLCAALPKKPSPRFDTSAFITEILSRTCCTSGGIGAADTWPTRAEGTSVLFDLEDSGVPGSSLPQLVLYEKIKIVS